MADRRTILVTGASGVIGCALLPRLHGHDVIALVHRGDIAGGPVQTVRCDVSARRFGLSEPQFRELAARTHCIVHCAAVTDWAEPNERFQSVNVGGTSNVLELAAAAEAPLFHMSTAFVQALGDTAPMRLDDSNIIVNYVRSKIESERLISESGLPHTVLRPSNCLGDSRTGEMHHNQIIQLVSEMVLRGKVPVFPARPGTLVDALPQDLVAEATRAVIDADDVGSEYWITAGEKAITVERAVSLCVDFAATIGLELEPPALVAPEAVDRDEVADMRPMVRRIFERLIEFGEGLEACGTFPSSLTALHERYRLPKVSCEDSYIRGLEFLARSKGMLPEQPQPV